MRGPPLWLKESTPLMSRLRCATNVYLLVRPFFSPYIPKQHLLFDKMICQYLALFERIYRSPCCGTLLYPLVKKRKEKKKAVLFGALKMIRYTELLIFQANDCTHTTFKDILEIFHHFIRALDHFMLKLGSKLSVCQGLGFPQSAGAGWHMSSPSFHCNFNVALTEEIRW